MKDTFQKWANDVLKDLPVVSQDMTPHEKQEVQERFPEWQGGITRPWLPQEKIELLSAMASFVLTLKRGIFATRVKWVAQENLILHRRLLDDVRSHITFEFYFRRLWKAVFFHLQKDLAWGSTQQLQRTARMFKVHHTDMDFVWSLTSTEDKKEHRIRSHTDILLTAIPPKEMSDMVIQLESHAKKLTRRMRFLAKYDAAQDREDQVSLLLIKGVASLRCYEWLAVRNSSGELVHDIPKILNYARRSMSNKAVDWLKWHTHESRARVVNMANDTERECSQCPGILKPKVLRCSLCGAQAVMSNSLADFQATTISHEPDMSGAVTSTRNWELWDSLDKNLSSVERTYVSILMDRGPQAFDTWLLQRYHTRVEKLQMRSLKWYASRWLQADSNLLDEHLKTILKEHC